MKHSDKIKLAKKLRSNAEIKANTPLFHTKGWSLRAQAKRVKRLVRDHIIFKK